AVVTKRALVRGPGLLVEPDDAVRAGRDAVTASVAHVLLDEDRVVLGAHDRVRGTDLETARVLTVLADVAHHQPGLPARDRRGRHDDAVVVGDVLDELDVTPVLGIELAGVVEAVEEKLRLVAFELVPLL